MVAAMRSGPDSTWIGRLSAKASSSSSAVRITQEKSRAIVSMPERPLRSSVLAILRAMPLSRLPKIANSTPEILFIAFDFRQARNVNDQASRFGKATGRTWVDDHGGER